jgi:hypothetical protein
MPCGMAPVRSQLPGVARGRWAGRAREGAEDMERGRASGGGAIPHAALFAWRVGAGVLGARSAGVLFQLFRNGCGAAAVGARAGSGVQCGQNVLGRGWQPPRNKKMKRSRAGSGDARLPAAHCRPAAWPWCFGGRSGACCFSCSASSAAGHPRPSDVSTTSRLRLT